MLENTRPSGYWIIRKLTPLETGFQITNPGMNYSVGHALVVVGLSQSLTGWIPGKQNIRARLLRSARNDVFEKLRCLTNSTHIALNCLQSPSSALLCRKLP